MTYHVPLSEPQINSYWLGIAIHLAKAEGADRYLTYSDRDPARYKQLKRLWWSCIIRDSVMALGLRRPIHIASSSFDNVWPQLTANDLRDETGRSYIHTAPVRMKLQRSLLALCEFCAILTNILQLLYPADGAQAIGSRLGLMKRLYIYTDELNQWHDTVVGNSEPVDQHDKSLNIVILFNNILSIYFQYDIFPYRL